MAHKPRLFSYVVRYDTGLAPNPFGGYCTLALCKPKIRRIAEIGDWVVGTGSESKGMGGKLIYAMLVTKKIGLSDYYVDKTFSNKKPNADNVIGDNIYFNDRLMHRYMHGPSNAADDLNGRYVLISESSSFYYFGKNAQDIEKIFPWIIKRGPNHKSKFTDAQIESFVNWLKNQHKPGRHGLPIDYRTSERWKTKIIEQDSKNDQYER